jgi:thiosulfate dehydrogenase (quinone) large subunit
MAVRSGYVEVEEAPWARWLFASKAAAWIWPVARLWLGYEWLHGGWEKVCSAPDGAAWWRTSRPSRASRPAPSKPPRNRPPQVAYDWWVSFLHWVSDNAVWMAKVVAVGELALGICLLLGLFTGVFAFLGLVLNFGFVFSGSAGVNPAFIVVGLLLVMACRNAGWIGLDRFLLPRLGTPWQRTMTTRTDRTLPS